MSLNEQATHGIARRYQCNATEPPTEEGRREAIVCMCGAKFEASSMKLANELFEEHLKNPEAKRRADISLPELHSLFEQYLLTLDNEYRNEEYRTDRNFAKKHIGKFLDWLEE